jgi:hypothetical protein
VAAQLVCSCLFVIAALAAPAFAMNANPSFLDQAEAGELLPGAYLWDPSIAPSGPLNMTVDLSSQRTFVYRGGRLIGISTISSGKPGHETPTGTFTVLQKERIHHSNLYDDAPMPYMERLAWSGLALHAGHVRGYPASHGCIHLPMGFAAALFREPTRGMQVVIEGHAPSREEIMMASRQNAPANSQCCQADDQAAGGAGYSNVNYESGQPRNDERNTVQEQGQDEPAPSQEDPAQALPPPPD